MNKKSIGETNMDIKMSFKKHPLNPLDGIAKGKGWQSLSE